MTTNCITTGAATALTAGAIRAAGAIITAGRRIVRVAKRLEEAAAEPHTFRCDVAWCLMTLGERVEALGEAVEAITSRIAARHGVDMVADVLEPAIARAYRS